MINEGKLPEVQQSSGSQGYRTKVFGSGTKLIVTGKLCGNYSNAKIKRLIVIIEKPFITVNCNTVGAAKIFGTGTKLVVTETEAKLDFNKVQVLPPFIEKDGKVTHVCLIEDFYPNVIKVTWEDEKKNAEKNAVLGEIWPPDDNLQSYSISSWLTVDKNSNKNYRCHYQHESKADFVPTASPAIKQYYHECQQSQAPSHWRQNKAARFLSAKKGCVNLQQESHLTIKALFTCYASILSGTSIAPQSTADCTNRLFIERFMHRTAYLIYIVLLLKSTMYYVIVLFFMFRMQSPIKRQGKKP
nr:uncharacterized protein LOC101942435 [Chrysemys picta bellii]